ncbi:FMN-binding protein [Ktedonobacteria bacterium brp13]|nr:FMN-binding protein [Ktedonobacteria bacterium brp13]
MKKLGVAFIIIGAFILYSIAFHRSNPALIAPDSTVGTNRSSPLSTGTSGSSGAASKQYRDGTYTGSVADAQWGNIQVKVIIQSGKIKDVQYLQYPNDRNRSIEINQYADPLLTTEAIQAQSGQVDIISGATDTSEAFIQSLSAALTQAQV